MTTTLKTGYISPPLDIHDAKLGTYITPAFPALPPLIGSKLTPPIGKRSWGMYGNDEHSDCVIAGAGHEHRLLTRLGAPRTPADFRTSDLLKAYGDITGFDPVTGDNDNGTDPREAAKYRRNHGLKDSKGNVHKISAFVGLNNPLDIARSIYLFGVAGVGIAFPESAMRQFDERLPWDVVAGEPDPNDGHYIPIIGRDAHAHTWTCITWGQEQILTDRFLAKYFDSGFGYLTPELTQGGKSPLGFDVKALLGYLGRL